MADKMFNFSAIMKGWFAGRPGCPVSSADQIDTAFPNNRSLYWRNAANTAEVSVIKLNASNKVELGNQPQMNDASGNEVIKTAGVSSAVNEVTVTNAATGSAPSLAASGGDTNIGLQLSAKGTGIVAVGDSGTASCTGTGATSTATLSKQVNRLTTASLTTAAGATHTITLTNTKVTANSVFSLEVSRAGATAGIPYITKVTPGAGTVDIEITNIHAAAAFNGTLRVALTILA